MHLFHGHFLFFLPFTRSFYFPLWKISMSAVLSHTHSLLVRFPSDKRLCFHCAHGIMDIFLPPLSHFHFPFFTLSLALILKENVSKKMYRSFQEHYDKKMKKKEEAKTGEGNPAGLSAHWGSIMENGLWL